MKPDLNIFLHFHDGKGTEDITAEDIITEDGSDYADGNYMNLIAMVSCSTFLWLEVLLPSPLCSVREDCFKPGNICHKIREDSSCVCKKGQCKILSEKTMYIVQS